MTDTSLDDLGPVDYLVVEFPAGASNFTGEMAAELLALVDSGTIRVIDVLILTKDADGAVDAMELADVGELGELQALEAQLAELLAADDVAHLAAPMEPGSTAGVLIWENLWAAPFASAARRSGGQLIANGRIPMQAIIASIEAEPTLRAGLRPRAERPPRTHPARGRAERYQRGHWGHHPCEGTGTTVAYGGRPPVASLPCAHSPPGATTGAAPSSPSGSPPSSSSPRSGRPPRASSSTTSSSRAPSLSGPTTSSKRSSRRRPA